jgi:hypothetical protein
MGEIVSGKKGNEMAACTGSIEYRDALWKTFGVSQQEKQNMETERL